MRNWKVTFAEWEDAYRPLLGRDPVWSVRAYRVGMFLLSVGWKDVERVMRVRVMAPSAGQLYRAIGSISANIAEGYGRRSPRDRARLYEYALGSLREALTWYWSARPVLGAERFAVRAAIVAELTALLVAMLKGERRRQPGTLGRPGVVGTSETPAIPRGELAESRGTR